VLQCGAATRERMRGGLGTEPRPPLPPPPQGRFVCSGRCIDAEGLDCWECFRPEDKARLVLPGGPVAATRDSYACDLNNGLA
jgi:hypothetical protein